MAKKKKNKDPLHIDNLIKMCKKEGNYEMAEEFQEAKSIARELKHLRAGNVITFEELVKLPEGYKYISNCSGSIDVEEMTDLRVEGGLVMWSQSTGDPEIELGTGEVRRIPHTADSEYEFTLYHILPKPPRKKVGRKLKSHPNEKKSVIKKIEKVIKKK